MATLTIRLSDEKQARLKQLAQHRFPHPLPRMVFGHRRRWLWWMVGIAIVGVCVAAGLRLASGASAQDDTRRRDILPLHNDLAQASSPYLRSAAQQPVAWQQ